MLVLSRKVGQELVIGDNIRITVNRVGGNRVTVGISAPDDVRIVRGELEPIVRSFEVEADTAALDHKLPDTRPECDSQQETKRCAPETGRSSSSQGPLAAEVTKGRNASRAASSHAPDSVDVTDARKSGPPAQAHSAWVVDAGNPLSDLDHQVQ